MPTNIDFQFTNNLESDDIHLTDTPEKYGIIEVHRGFSNNYCTILFYSADINSIWRYNFHTENSSANGWIKLTSNKDLQGGRIAAITCSPGNITEYNLSFPKRFLSVPKVMLTIASNSTSAKYGSLLPMINSVTVSGCVIRIANNSDIQLSPSVDWIAINI